MFCRVHELNSTAQHVTLRFTRVYQNFKEKWTNWSVLRLSVWFLILPVVPHFQRSYVTSESVGSLIRLGVSELFGVKQDKDNGGGHGGW